MIHPRNKYLLPQRVNASAHSLLEQIILAPLYEVEQRPKEMLVLLLLKIVLLSCPREKRRACQTPHLCILPRRLFVSYLGV